MASCATALAAPAAAYRPFDTTDADVVDRGEIEIELQPVGYVNDDGSDVVVAPDVVLNVGLHPCIELVLEGRALFARDGDAEDELRIADTALLGKGLLRRGTLQGGDGPSVAVEAGVLLPTLHDEGGIGAEAIGIVSQRWSLLAAHLNGNVAYTRATTWELGVGLILEGPAHRGIRPVAEATWFRTLDEASGASGLVGIVFEPRDDLALDVAFRYERDDGSDVRELRAGLTWSFHGAWGARP